MIYIYIMYIYIYCITQLQLASPNFKASPENCPQSVGFKRGLQAFYGSKPWGMTNPFRMVI